jgi:hypothetical protein
VIFAFFQNSKTSFKDKIAKRGETGEGSKCQDKFSLFEKKGFWGVNETP